MSKSKIASFEIPSDYGCLALINPNTYVSFVNDNWQLEKFLAHFISQINQKHMIAWGCVYGNWKIEIHDKFSNIKGHKETYQNIYSDGKILLVNYESLTEAAQFSDETLPLDDLEKFQFTIPTGNYLCRVIQLFNSSEAESEKVFYQDTPHFIIELNKNRENLITCSKIPWFPL